MFLFNFGNRDIKKDNNLICYVRLYGNIPMFAKQSTDSEVWVCFVFSSAQFSAVSNRVCPTQIISCLIQKAPCPVAYIAGCAVDSLSCLPVLFRTYVS